MISRILNLIKTYQHGLFIGLCMVLMAGIGYNIGRISEVNTSSDSINQQANIYSSTSSKQATQAIKSTRPAVPKDLRVVASKAASSKLYHHPWCSGVQRIKETNKLWFPTEADAIAAGYSLAGNCQ